jgi:hypothetical protein
MLQQQVAHAQAPWYLASADKNSTIKKTKTQKSSANHSFQMSG